MLEVYCPHCGTLLNIDDTTADERIECANCGGVIPITEDALRPGAIEVYAEESEAVRAEPVFDDDPLFGPSARAGPVGQFVFRTSEAEQSGSSCCLFGCLLVGTILFLAVLGFLSLFS